MVLGAAVEKEKKLKSKDPRFESLSERSFKKLLWTTTKESTLVEKLKDFLTSQTVLIILVLPPSCTARQFFK